MAAISIGDCISLITLTTTMFQALSSSRGSKTEFQSLLSTLRSLSQAMCQAEALCVGYYTSAEYSNVRGWSHEHGDGYEHNQDTEDKAKLAKEEAKRKAIEDVVGGIKRERDECEVLIRNFMSDFKGHGKSFGDMRPKVVDREKMKKGDRDAREGEKGEEDVWIENRDDSSEKRLDSLDRGTKIRELGASGMGKLKHGYRSLTWIRRQSDITALEKRLTTRLQTIQLLLYSFCYATMKSDMVDHTHLLGNIDHSVGALTTGFGDMQLQISEALSKLEVVRKCLPQAIGYCWGPQAPILLLDGLGRKTLLPMLLVRTPDVFRDILLIMHKDGPGYDKIENGKYVVSDEDASGALVLRDKWQDSIQPGKRIGLSFLLKHPGTSDEKQCPRCKSMPEWLNDHPGQRRCLNCNLTYKIEDRERTRLYWADLKKRPKPPTRQSAPNVPAIKKKGTPIRPLSRSRTLPEEEFAHPYQRVHYQRDVLRRTPVEKPWEKADPEFDEFLNALPPLHRAAATGDVEKLDDILADGECDHMDWKISATSLFRHDRTGWDFTGAPPIHFAAYYGHKHAVLYLLQHGVDIDGKDAAGTTALHAAAWTGNEGLFQTLLKKGADASICDYDGWSVAIYAMSQGHDGISRMVLENSAEESGEDVGTLVKSYKIRYAAKLGNTDTVLEILLEDQAAPINADVTELFLCEALVGAAEGGHEELVKKLLEMGADPARIDTSGSTALHWAAWGGHAEIGNILYNEKTEHANSQNDKAIHLSTQSSLPIIEDAPRSVHHENCMRMLLEKGADVNAQNVQGCTALHWVAGAGSAPMIRFLMAMGADVGIQDHVGRTPVDRAIETGDDGVVGMLREERQSLSV